MRGGDDEVSDEIGEDEGHYIADVAIRVAQLHEVATAHSLQTRVQHLPRVQRQQLQGLCVCGECGVCVWVVESVCRGVGSGVCGMWVWEGAKTVELEYYLRLREELNV